MAVYKITRKIKRFEIFQPKTTLKKWYNAQSDKPDILFNASLYTSTNKPCGTIYDNGVLVSNQGKGFGFGTLSDRSTVVFGGPWDNTWYDYLTGYYGLVQSGQVIDPPWTDKYVFDCALSRIAFGQLNDGNYAIFCEDGKTIKTFAKDGANYGFKHLCNLDGGGSRALLWLGKWIYTSSRTPYNAIAIWLEEETAPKVEGDYLNIKCIKKTQVYNASGTLESGRYITAGDVCSLGTTVSGNLLIEIIYPTSSGNRKAYIKNLTNFIVV